MPFKVLRREIEILNGPEALVELNQVYFVRLCNDSLRSKRIRRGLRMFEAFLAFWPLPFFALTPVFAQPKSERCIQWVEKPSSWPAAVSTPE